MQAMRGKYWRACMSCCEGARGSAGGAPTELVSGACQPCTQQPLVETRCVQVRCSALMLVRKSAVCVRYLAPVPLERSRAAGVHAQDVCFARQCLMPASVLAAQDDARTKHRRPGKAGQGDVCKFTPPRIQSSKRWTPTDHTWRLPGHWPQLNGRTVPRQRCPRARPR